jgi:hypothetical protein
MVIQKLRTSSMKNWAPFILTAISVAALFSSGSASAQYTPLPLGHVNHPVKSVSCPGGYDSGTLCYSSTVSCPNTSDIGFTYGVVNPGGKDGTIVFFNGDDGTTVGFTQYVEAYGPPAHDYQSVQVIWATAWEETGNGTGTSLKTAACRPATLLDWLLNQRNVYSGGGMCAQGASAGSAAIAYSLAEYGAQYLNHVVLESGPVLSDVSVGCNPNSSSVTVCPGNECLTGREGSWPDSPIYVDGNEDSVSTWTGAYGQNSCAGGNRIPQTQYTAWKNMSIVDGNPSDSTFNYPKTSLSGWLCSKPVGCDSCQNNSAAQGQLFYQNVTSSKSVYRVDNCQGTEGVEQGSVPEFDGESGLQAIINDMVGQCSAPRRRNDSAPDGQLEIDARGAAQAEHQPD